MSDNIVAITLPNQEQSVSVGRLVEGVCSVGERATIILQDENGMPVWQYGVIVEVLE